MSLLDSILICLTIFSILFGLWKGFVSEVLSFFAWWFGYDFAIRYYGVLVPVLAPYIKDVFILNFVAKFFMFVMIFFFFKIASFFLRNFIKLIHLQWLNAMLGVIFGFARAYCLIFVFFFLYLELGIDFQKSSVHESIFFQHFADRRQKAPLILKDFSSGIIKVLDFLNRIKKPDDKVDKKFVSEISDLDLKTVIEVANKYYKFFDDPQQDKIKDSQFSSNTIKEH